MTGKRGAWLLNSKGIQTREQQIADLHAELGRTAPPAATPKVSDAALTKLADHADAAAADAPPVP